MGAGGGGVVARTARYPRGHRTLNDAVVEQIVAGAGVVVSPSDGTGVVTVSAAGGGFPGFGAPPVDVDAGAASGGVGATAARFDHKHHAAVGVPVDVGAAVSEGAAVELARRDHVHRGVRSLKVSGGPPDVFGDVVLVAGAGVLLSQAGQLIGVAADLAVTSKRSLVLSLDDVREVHQGDGDIVVAEWNIDPSLFQVPSAVVCRFAGLALKPDVGTDLLVQVAIGGAVDVAGGSVFGGSFVLPGGAAVASYVKKKSVPPGAVDVGILDSGSGVLVKIVAGITGGAASELGRIRGLTVELVG